MPWAIRGASRLDGRVLRRPDSRTSMECVSAYKSDHVHIVPLITEAVTILEQVLRDQSPSDGDFIFSGTNGKKPLAGWTKGQRRMERALLAVSGERPVVRWTPHDLRRTVATRIAEKLGVGGEQLIKRVLGHSDGSVTAIYNRYGYVREMRSVLERWALDLTRESPTSSQADEVNSAVQVVASRSCRRRLKAVDTSQTHRHIRLKGD